MACRPALRLVVCRREQRHCDSDDDQTDGNQMHRWCCGGCCWTTSSPDVTARQLIMRLLAKFALLRIVRRWQSCRMTALSLRRHCWIRLRQEGHPARRKSSFSSPPKFSFGCLWENRTKWSNLTHFSFFPFFSFQVNLNLFKKSFSS